MRHVLLMVLLCLFAAQATAIWTNEPFLREPNITLNYSKIPWVLRGITPQLPSVAQFSDDAIGPIVTPMRLDPRTCPGEIAYCYQIREHGFSKELTYGANYTHASSYVLPEERIKLFFCIGNDTACVGRATSCFCQAAQLPLQEHMRTYSTTCSDSKHLCRSSELGFTLCEGTLEECRTQYISCGCGRSAACTAQTVNVCVNARDELIICRASLASCLGKYDTCFCGSELMNLQEGCTAIMHECRDGNATQVCKGGFVECAIKHEACTCGIPA